MTIVHDDAYFDSIAVLALGALPEAEARELVAHIATCDTCRREYAELRAAADLVGYGAEAAATDIDELAATRMKSRVMGALQATPRSEPTPATDGARRNLPTSRRFASKWLAYGAAAAAIIVALLTSANNATLRSQRASDAERIAQLERRTAAQTSAQASADAAARSRVAALLAPDRKRYPVPGGAVVTSGGRVFLAMHAMAPPPPGKVYQAWTLALGKKTVAPSVTFVPGTGGTTIVELPERSTGLAAVAVSIEPAGGSQAPTTKPAFVRPLS